MLFETGGQMFDSVHGQGYGDKVGEDLFSGSKY